MLKFDWLNATEGERAAYNAGYAAGNESIAAEAALRKIMKHFGIVSATYGEVAERACKRLDRLEDVIAQCRKVAGEHVRSINGLLFWVY